MLPGLCVDLETTIAARVPDEIRPKGQKRFETRIIEIGAVLWKNPSITFGCLVNPIPLHIRLKNVDHLKQQLKKMYQKPNNTIDFWSKVLVKRKSLSRKMLSMTPKDWLQQDTDKRGEYFVKWHNAPNTGPAFLSESNALQKLNQFSNTHHVNVWYAHNGNSFDFKILQGCAQRTRCSLPKNIAYIDTLRLFRRIVPNLPSYSQPILYKSLFQSTYNAHVAIDDAKALARLCQWANEKKSPSEKHSGPILRSMTKEHVEPKKIKPMNLQFKKISQTKLRRIAMNLTFRVR